MKTDFVDSFLSFVSPARALTRAKYKLALDELRKYDAAAKGRRNSDWFASGASANTETRSALSVLRDRSRDLVRNNPYAKSAIDIISNNTIGAGIVPSIKAKNESILKIIKSNWKIWAETNTCDADNRLTFYGIQKIAMRAVAESGEVIIRKKRVPQSTSFLGFQIQVLESDFLDLNKTIPMIESGGYIIQGIEFDKKGNRVAYWLYQIHPGESSLSQPVRAWISTRVPAEEIIHIYNKERPGQERGVPMGVAAFMRMKDFDDYEDAQLMRQKIAACFAVFIEDYDPSGLTTKSTGKKKLSERVQPGIIEHVPPGKKVSFANPPGVQNYEEYCRKMIQGIAAAYGITYESIAKDLSKVNFSSGRMGWLEMHRNITDWQQNIIIPSLCVGIMKWFIDALVFIEEINEGDFVSSSWTAPRREMIDPVKETTGITNQIRSGMRTWSESVREQGFEPEEVLSEYAAELKLFDKYGIIFDTDMRHQVQQTVAPPLVGAKTGA